MPASLERQTRPGPTDRRRVSREPACQSLRLVVVLVPHGQLRPRTTVCRVSARAVVAAAIQYLEEREPLVRAAMVALARAFNHMRQVVVVAPVPLVETVHRPTVRTQGQEEATAVLVCRPVSRVVPRSTVAAAELVSTERVVLVGTERRPGVAGLVVVAPEQSWQVEPPASLVRAVWQIPVVVVVARAYAVPWDTRVRGALAARA